MIQAGQVIGNIDAGGGTSEGAVYEISHGDPLRLSREVVAATGESCYTSHVDQSSNSVQGSCVEELT